MIPFPIVVLIALVGLLVGVYLASWFKNRRLRRLTVAVADLEQQVAVVNEQLDQDPQRAGIDMGKRYTINQVQATIDRLRREVPRS